MDLTNVLINFGADKNIKNNEGLFIETDNDSEELNQNDANNTDPFLEHLSKETQQGGDRESILGQRQMLFFKESGSKNKRHNHTTSSDSKLARIINNQASEIHDRVKQKIKELYKDLDDNELRIIKAAIYSFVKKNNPELSNLDRAVEMEKIQQKNSLKN